MADEVMTWRHVGQVLWSRCHRVRHASQKWWLQGRTWSCWSLISKHTEQRNSVALASNSCCHSAKKASGDAAVAVAVDAMEMSRGIDERLHDGCTYTKNPCQPTTSNQCPAGNPDRTRDAPNSLKKDVEPLFRATSSRLSGWLEHCHGHLWSSSRVEDPAPCEAAEDPLGTVLHCKKKDPLRVPEEAR